LELAIERLLSSSQSSSLKSSFPLSKDQATAAARAAGEASDPDQANPAILAGGTKVKRETAALVTTKCYHKSRAKAPQ
jgi:hypothetical protein